MLKEINDYTIPRTVRELQLMTLVEYWSLNYTIPRTVRELQLTPLIRVLMPQLYHTKNCQGTTTMRSHLCLHTILYHTKNCQGTTTFPYRSAAHLEIIPYQELSGNYNQPL